jgi:formate dehydrogenase gamma subunit
MEKIKTEKNLKEVKFLRMTSNERIQHFILLVSFITLVITGFWLKYPEAFWVKWIIAVLGKSAFELRGVIHRTASIVMIAGGVYHICYLIFTLKGRQFFRDILPAKNDIKNITDTAKYYLTNKYEKPKFGRFSYIEKAEYWAVVWGTVIMGVTGIMLWAQNKFLPLIHTSGMDIATAIHFYEAILATLAIVVWHFYFIFLNPDVAPMNKAWFSGYLNYEEMEKEHPLELEKLMNEKESEKQNEHEEKGTIKDENKNDEEQKVESDTQVNIQEAPSK